MCSGEHRNTNEAVLSWCLALNNPSSECGIWVETGMGAKFTFRSGAGWKGFLENPLCPYTPFELPSEIDIHFNPYPKQCLLFKQIISSSICALQQNIWPTTTTKTSHEASYASTKSLSTSTFELLLIFCARHSVLGQVASSSYFWLLTIKPGITNWRLAKFDWLWSVNRRSITKFQWFLRRSDDSWSILLQQIKNNNFQRVVKYLEKNSESIEPDTKNCSRTMNALWMHAAWKDMWSMETCAVWNACICVYEFVCLC